MSDDDDQPASMRGTPPVDSSAASPAASRWQFRLEPHLLVLLFVCFAVLARLFPLSGDDWAWGSTEGMERLEDRFDGYNGRWAGNLAVLALTRAEFMAPLVVSATLCLLLFLMARISGIKGITGYAVGTALLLTMPLGTWRQSVVWLSGFSNYALGSVGLVAFVWMTQRSFSGVPRSRPVLVAALTVPAAVVSALFIEHVTVSLVFFSVVALVVVVVQRRPWLVPAAWALGATIGAAIMFSNASYRNVVSGTSTYHKVDESGPGVMLDHALGGVSALSVAHNETLNVALAVTVALLLWQVFQRTGRFPMGGAVALTGAVVLVVAGVGVTSVPQFWTQWSWVAVVGLLVAVTAAAWFLVADVGRRVTLIALLALFVALVAPAAVLRPYGPRNFMPSYLVAMLIVMLLVREFVAIQACQESRDAARVGAAAVATAVGFSVALVSFAGYLAVFTQIDRVDRERLEQISSRAEKGRSKVTVARLPYPHYVHHSDPPNDVYLERFKRFHGFPDSMRITFTP